MTKYEIDHLTMVVPVTAAIVSSKGQKLLETGKYSFASVKASGSGTAYLPPECVHLVYRTAFPADLDE